MDGVKMSSIIITTDNLEIETAPVNGKWSLKKMRCRKCGKKTSFQFCTEHDDKQNKLFEKEKDKDK